MLQRFPPSRLWASGSTRHFSSFFRTKGIIKSTLALEHSNLEDFEPFRSYSTSTINFAPSGLSNTSGLTSTSKSKTKENRTQITEDSQDKLVDEGALICARAKEIFSMANQSTRGSFSARDKFVSSSFDKGGEIHTIRLEFENAVEAADELISMTTAMSSPLSSIPLYQYTAIHSSFLSVITWLLHLINFATDKPSKKNEKLGLCFEDQQKCIETIVALTQHASYLKLPLHLPLHTELINNCAQKLPIGRASPTILNLCSSLKVSFPYFKTWESFLFPILRQRLESSNREQLGSTSTEIKTILEVTQNEYKYNLRWEYALILLRSLINKLDLHHTQDGNRIIEKKTVKKINEKVDENTMKLIRKLSEPLELMLESKRKKMKELSQKVHDLSKLLLQQEKEGGDDIQADSLQMLLDRLIIQDGYDEDDDEDDEDDDEEEDYHDENDCIENVLSLEQGKAKHGHKDTVESLHFDQRMELEDAIALVQQISDEMEDDYDLDFVGFEDDLDDE